MPPKLDAKSTDISVTFVPERPETASARARTLATAPATAPATALVDGVLCREHKGRPAALAAALASQLDLPLLPETANPSAMEGGRLLVLVEGDHGSLQQTGRGAPGPVPVTFTDATLSHRRRSGHNELLGKAVGWQQGRELRVVDTTGGYARDAFVLADLGCQLMLCEREPVMAALLALALEEARAGTDDWLREVCARIQLHTGDARELTEAGLEADVIYLDPMFSEPRKAAPGKAMQALQTLTGTRSGEERDAAELLDWARAQAVRRVVVKRARRAPLLGGQSPGHSLQGKAVRFDVYPVMAKEGRQSGPGKK